MFKLLITVRNFEKRFPEALRYLRENGAEITFCPQLAQLSPDEKRAVLADKEALFVTAERCGRELLDLAENVRILSRMGSGMDGVDLEYCKSRGICVTNSKGCNAAAVAEMTLMLILSSLRGLNKLYRIASQGRWEERYAGKQLQGKTVGLLGFGQIAQKLAELLIPFGVKIIASDPYMNHGRAAELGVKPCDLAALLAEADILSVHIPALKENVGMFHGDAFAQMKDGAVFINCARGALVDEEALYQALESGKLYAAASDVFVTEPVQPHHKLFDLPNFIGTPHEAGMTLESAYADSMAVATSIAAFMRGEEPGYRVV